MLRCARHSGTLAIPLMAAASAFAQQAYQSPAVQGVPSMLQRLDPMRQDVGPLSDSLREVNMQVDLRTPTGFQNVYRVPGRDDLLMRASGGVYAIFPESVYVQTEKGMLIKVPPGTTYSIGMPGPGSLPSAWTQPPHIQSLEAGAAPRAAPQGNPAALPSSGHSTMAASTLVSDRINARRNTQVDDAQWPQDAAAAAGADVADAETTRREKMVRGKPPEAGRFLTTVVTDDAFRAHRLAELLQRATEAAKGGGG